MGFQSVTIKVENLTDHKLKVNFVYRIYDFDGSNHEFKIGPSNNGILLGPKNI